MRELNDWVPTGWNLFPGLNDWVATGWKLVNPSDKTFSLFLAADRPHKQPCKKASIVFPKHLSSPKPGHTTGGSGRGARHGGGAGSGRAGCQQNCSPRGQETFVPPKASNSRLLNVPPEARTSEILFNSFYLNRVREQNHRLTSG